MNIPKSEKPNSLLLGRECISCGDWVWKDFPADPGPALKAEGPEFGLPSTTEVLSALPQVA